MQNKVYLLLISVFFLVIFIALPNKSVVRANGQEVCPDGGAWHKITNSPFEYTAEEGMVVVEVCVKGGSDDSSNGYLEYFTQDGIFEVTYPTNKEPPIVYATKTCVEVSGIGTATAEATNGDAPGKYCAEISHASFKVEEEPEEEIYGCTDPEANNYDPEATIDDESCTYDEEEVLGCTDPEATNYDPNATKDDGSCLFEEEVLGCTDATATNYDPNATQDDGSCTYKQDDGGDDDDDDDNDDDEDDDDDDEDEDEDEEEGEVLGASTGGTGGSVLGTSTLAATGTAEENLINLTFTFGTMLLGLGVKKYAPKSA